MVLRSDSGRLSRGDEVRSADGGGGDGMGDDEESLLSRSPPTVHSYHTVPLGSDVVTLEEVDDARGRLAAV